MSDTKSFIQSLYAAFSRGDVPLIIANVDETVEWVSNCPAASIPWGGTRRGPQGALRFFEALEQNLEFELFEPREFAADGDLVFVRGRTVARVKATGRRLDSEWVHAFAVGGGRIKRFQEFYDTAAVLAALQPS